MLSDEPHALRQLLGDMHFQPQQRAVILCLGFLFLPFLRWFPLDISGSVLRALKQCTFMQQNTASGFVISIQQS